MGLRRDEHNTNFNSKHFKEEEEGHGSGSWFLSLLNVMRYLENSWVFYMKKKSVL